MKTLQQLSIIAGILGLGLAGCSKRQAETAQPPIVRTFEIAQARKTISAYTGVIHARTESDLAFRVGGKIVARLVNAGERVTRGQPLLRIDPTDFELALSSAKSAVDAARAHRIAAAAREERMRKLLAQRVTSAESY
jgi:multidrug efflux pump subunit AcrA (membrane-fusion protein)